MNQGNKVDSFSDQEFEKIIKESRSLTDVERKMGYCIYGRHTRDKIRARCERQNVSMQHFTRKLPNTKARKITDDRAFVQNSSLQGHNLKRRLLVDNLKEYKCCVCGNTGEWQGRPLSLQVHHINGVHNDNRLENLAFLCPNCHSQTDSFAGKGQRRAK